jgi:plastocyanin
MTRLRLLAFGVLVGLGTAAFAAVTPSRSDDDGGGRRITIRDEGADITTPEIIEEAVSPFADSVVGHQAFRNDPSYLKIREGQTVRVRNVGTRPHTLTEVEEFHAGTPPAQFAALFNFGLDPPPGVNPCQNAEVLGPGARTTVSGLASGNHRFMCCIHPWMRAIIKVVPEEEDEEEEDDE